MVGPMTRRALLGTSAATLALAPWKMNSAWAADQNKDTELREAARAIPLVSDCDVIVCGGGPAGIAAAISAARSGAKVRLFECHGCLGGVWTSGMLSFVIDAAKPGLNAEITAKLDALGAKMTDYRKSDDSHYVYDVEGMKYLLETLFDELKIDYVYHSRVVAVEKDSNNRVRAIVTESKSGREAWAAPVFIDTTGDGDVGALAGCQWQFGEDKTCPCQPMSLMGIIAADPAALAEYDTAQTSDNKDRLREEMLRAGVEPSYAKPTLWNFGHGVAAVMINHEYGVEPFDAAQVTRATVNARRELYHITQALKKTGGMWENIRLVATAEQIGVRDGRRIQGRYEVSVNDVIAGIRHDDAICRSHFSVDVHAATQEQNRKAAYGSKGVKAKPFDIPLRALIAAEVDGLLMAGRCISGDFFAHASYRVTGNAVAMGEAAGVAAALSAQKQMLPHQLPWIAVATQLETVRNQADNNALLAASRP